MADLSLLFSIKAKNEAAAELKAVERQIAALKERIKEVKAEGAGEVGFKKERIAALQGSLSELTNKHKELKLAQAASSRSSEDFTSALSAVSPRLGSVANSLTGTVGPLTGFATGLTVGITAVVGLGTAIFALTKQTAEFQGKFLDLSQQVGVTVETLSTLDVIASTTGGNIDSVTASLGIFQKHLEASHDPTSKEAKLLGELGVTSTNVEVALRQTIKGLFDLTDKTKQTDAALQLFGRGGRFVNAILKESHGDLDLATAKFQAMGLVVGGPAAAAADHFNDSLEILSRQLDAIGRQLTSKTIPVFTVFFEDLNEALTGSKDNWSSWGNLIETTVAAAIAHLKTFAQFIATRGNIDFESTFFINRDDILRRARALTAGLTAEDAAERAARLARSSGRPGDTPDAGKAAAAAQARANKEIALTNRELERLTQFHRQVLERERQLDLKTTDEWVEASIDAALEHLGKQQAILESERENVRKFIKNRVDRAQALADIDLRDQQEQDVFQLSTQKAQDEGNKRRAASELALNRQLAQIRDSAREGELVRIKDELDRKAVTEAEAKARELALLKDAQAQRLLLIEFELGQQTTSADRKIELDNLKLESEQRYSDAFKKLTQERIDAINKEQAEEEQKRLRIKQLEEEEIARRSGRKADKDTGPPPPPLPIPIDWNAQLITAGIDTMRDAFAALGQAVGQAVQAFVLFGSAGTSFRKFTAEVLASVAAQAAVKAIFELGEGLAMLALSYFTGNPKYAASAGAHFAAAAIYGGIAGVVTIAGRAVAGDAFKTKSESGGGSDTGGDRGALNTIETGRNQRQDRTIRIVLTSDLGELRKVIVGHVVRDYNDGGEIREVIANDGR